MATTQTIKNAIMETARQESLVLYDGVSKEAYAKIVARDDTYKAILVRIDRRVANAESIDCECGHSEIVNVIRDLLSGDKFNVGALYTALGVYYTELGQE